MTHRHLLTPAIIECYPFFPSVSYVRLIILKSLFMRDLLAATFALVQHNALAFKVKLSPKSNLGCICECIWVKPLCKSIITKKKGTYRSFVFGQANFKRSAAGARTFVRCIKIAIFKTPRRLHTTWNFTHSISRVSTHECEHREHCCVHRVY